MERKELQEIKNRLSKFVPVEIGVDETLIDKRHRPVIAKLVKAAQIIDRLYLTQVSKENLELRASLFATEPQEIIDYFDIMYGPWDRLDENRPFIGNKPKPAGATFYPEGLTGEAFEAWLDSHPDDRQAFESYFTIIESRKEGLVARPYSDVYRAHLAPAAHVLRAAASHSDDPRLARYLKSRADAFNTNRYRDSDMDWMSLDDGVLEVVIGPYEVYEDALLGLKTAFEAVIAIRNPEDSTRLETIKSYLPEMELTLPIPDEFKNRHRGTQSPISVVDVLFTAGDSRAGVQTMAFNLPNDEVAREAMGSKKVLFKNVARAKFEQILLPIARCLLAPDQLDRVTFDAFFNHTLLHETAHGLGPGRILPSEHTCVTEATTVNGALKTHYSVIEEAKADVLGMYLNYLLIEKGFHEATFEHEVYATFLAGFFRSIRFGATEAHGKANIVQYNYLKSKNAIATTDDGRHRLNMENMREAVTSLAEALLIIEARGDIQGAADFLAEYGAPSPSIDEAVGKLKDIPIDIRPIYAVEHQATSWFPSWLP